MEANDAFDFICWKTYLDQEGKWHPDSKLEYALARVAYQVYLIRHCLVGKGKPADEKNFLVEYGDSSLKLYAPPEEYDSDYFVDGGCEEAKEGGIEIGVDQLDEKWQAVAEEAKDEWKAFLGDFIVSTTPAPGSQSG